MEEQQKHIYQAGHLLVLMIWIQNIMSDFIILKRNPELLVDFRGMGSNPEFGDLRNEYWQKTFGPIKKEFIEYFPEVSNEYSDNLNLLQHLRDFFAHSRYSLKTNIIFYQPTKSRRDLQEKVETLTKIPFDENQTFLKVKMGEEKYQEIFDELMNFENIIFPKIAREMDFDLNRLK